MNRTQLISKIASIEDSVQLNAAEINACLSALKKVLMTENLEDVLGALGIKLLITPLFDENQKMSHDVEVKENL